MSSFYVTTAIPYVNATPHLGFALELVQADVLARYHRLRGDDTWFLTGTDENSLTNVLAAEREHLPVRALVDRNAAVFRSLAVTLHLSHDDFIRTATDARHLEGAQRFWKACVRAGDVYRRSYRGLYCVRCERFYTADELSDGRCPAHGLPPEPVEEDNYFFRLSRYERRLAELLDSRRLRVLPDSRHHEVRAFIARGLEDFSISRTQARARGWGIPVPGDPEQVIYVWFDALTNYVTALGYGTSAERYRRSWVETTQRVHVIGKDILRFHAVYWPAMLLAAGAPLPTTIVVHGFVTRDGRRMSKTLGTGVDPLPLIEAWGVDAVRYWLLREVPPVDDADYTEASFARVYAADLANDLGNLLHRTVSMIQRYRAGVVEARLSTATSALRAFAEPLAAALHRGLGEDWDPRGALKAVWALVGAGNRLVEDARPWTLARDERGGDTGAGHRLDLVLWELAESLRLVAEALRPLLPTTAAAIAEQLGVGPASAWARGIQWGGLGAGTRVGTATPLFPRREPGQAASLAHE
jgi:methionyl-tRNA synthetase